MNKNSIIAAVIVIALIAGGVMYFTKQKSGSSNPGVSGGSSTVGGGSDMQQFREDHKFTFQLTRFVGNISRLDKETDTPLTQDQATKILAQLEPLRKATSMNQDEAKDNIKKLQAILTTDQRDNIAKMKERKRKFNGPGGNSAPGGQNGGGQAGAGQGGQAGARRGGTPQMVQNFNPFASGESRSAKRWDKYFAELKDRADGKPAVKMTEEEKKAIEERDKQGSGGDGLPSPPSGG